MAPKNTKQKGLQAALTMSVNAMRELLKNPGATDDTPEDQKYMDPSSFFMNMLPTPQDRTRYAQELFTWLQTKGVPSAHHLKALLACGERGEWGRRF